MSKVLQLTFMYHERFKTTSSNMFFSSVKLILCSLVLMHCSTESVGCHEISFTYNHPSLSLPSCEKQQNQKSLRESDTYTHAHAHAHTHVHTCTHYTLYSCTVVGSSPFCLHLLLVLLLTPWAFFANDASLLSNNAFLLTNNASVSISSCGNLEVFLFAGLLLPGDLSPVPAVIVIFLLLW